MKRFKKTFIGLITALLIALTTQILMPNWEMNAINEYIKYIQENIINHNS